MTDRGPLPDFDAIGAMDASLVALLQAGRVAPTARVLDAGAGGGRNLAWFLRRGFEVAAIDRTEAAVAKLRALALKVGRPDAADRMRVESIEDASFLDRSFDLVICNAVLHFAADLAAFRRQVDALHRVLDRGGICFSRLATTITMEANAVAVRERGEGWHRFPDGSEYFLVDLATLLGETHRLAAELIEPIKTVNVQHQRCMTTWVWRRTD